MATDHLCELGNPRLLAWSEDDGVQFARLFPEGGSSRERKPCPGALTLSRHELAGGGPDLWSVSVPIALLRRMPFTLGAHWLKCNWVSGTRGAVLWRGVTENAPHPIQVDEIALVVEFRDAAERALARAVDRAPCTRECLEPWHELARCFAALSPLVRVHEVQDEGMINAAELAALQEACEALCAAPVAPPAERGNGLPLLRVHAHRATSHAVVEAFLAEHRDRVKPEHAAELRSVHFGTLRVTRAIVHALWLEIVTRDAVAAIGT